MGVIVKMKNWCFYSWARWCSSLGKSPS